MLRGAAGLVAWHFLREWQWMLGSLLLLANWPFTMLVIMPTNKRLMAMQPQDAGWKAVPCCVVGAASTASGARLALLHHSCCLGPPGHALGRTRERLGRVTTRK
jgi:hypothetical protein